VGRPKPDCRWPVGGAVGKCFSAEALPGGPVWCDIAAPSPSLAALLLFLRYCYTLGGVLLWDLGYPGYG